MEHRELWVDFNDVDSDLRVSTLVARAEPGVHLQAGATVIVGDDEGNIALAMVVGVDREGIVDLVVDGTSFRPSDASHSEAVSA